MLHDLHYSKVLDKKNRAGQLRSAAWPRDVSNDYSAGLTLVLLFFVQLWRRPSLRLHPRDIGVELLWRNSSAGKSKFDSVRLFGIYPGGIVDGPEHARGCDLEFIRTELLQSHRDRRFHHHPPLLKFATDNLCVRCVVHTIFS